MITTKRLILKPLTYDQLVKYIKADNSLETELNLNETSRSISPELKEAIEQTILPNVADKTKDYLYSTLWTLISKEHNKMVGDICIVGEPNSEGEIEIGYGTYDEFQKKGFMTEAVGGIISWAKTQPKIVSIIASTEKENVASFTILQKNNFLKTGASETLFHWKLKLNKMIIREAKLEDIEQIQVVRNSVTENTLSNPALVTNKDCEEFMFERGKGWVCEIDNQIVGFSIVDLKENNIWALFLDPKFEKKGIGQQLHKIMLDWYFKQTKEKVWLGTAFNTRAEQFYRKAGWTAIGTHGTKEIKFEMSFDDWTTLQNYNVQL